MCTDLTAATRSATDLAGDKRGQRPGKQPRRFVVHSPTQVTHDGSCRCEDARVAPRFLTLADVAETLNISASQTYALVRSGDLPAIKVGGRGQWRVEASELEAYITRMYTETADFVRAHPLGRDDATEAPPEI